VTSQANIVVDHRVLPGDIRLSKGHVMQVLTGSQHLLPLEKEALTKAISAEFLKQEGWSEESDGEILNARGRLYGLGYATAIRKLLRRHIG
jgi:hypothetical protein